MENIPSNSAEFYRSPTDMEPLFPEDSSGILENLALELVEKAARLSGTMNPITRNAIAEFLRPMNSYYSNLIEGHDTHPIEIDKALKNDYSNNKEKKDLQIEAKAHINVHKIISDQFSNGTFSPSPTSVDYLKFIHKEFYNHLPEEFKKAKTRTGEYKDVVPGEFRDCEVQVGNHIGPYSKNLPAFMTRFEDFYNPAANVNKLKTRRLISIAASHHRLAWIHPFLDGNGRVVRLFSDALFMYEKVDANGLWSISRGLARTNDEYKSRLSNADLTRYNDYDGRGNLSEKMLMEFCIYFLETAIDQIEYMYKMIDTRTMIKRIEFFVDLMVIKGKLKPEAKFILVDIFLKGKISRLDAKRITGLSDKTLKLLVDDLIQLELIKASLEAGNTMIYYVNYPIRYSPSLFPSLYPGSKEVDMMEYL